MVGQISYTRLAYYKRALLIIPILGCGLLWMHAEATEFSNWVSHEVSVNERLDSSTFSVPTRQQRVHFRNAVLALLNKDFAGAETWASLIHYKIYNGPFYYGLTPLPQHAANHHGHFFIHKTPIRRWHIQTPHAIYDRDSATVSAHIFESMAMSYFMFNGYSRCAAKERSTCSGMTSICGKKNEPYSVSDVAHFENSYFQIFHEVTFTHDPGLRVLQIHGMNEKTYRIMFSMSDGTKTISEEPGHFGNAFVEKMNGKLRVLSAPLLGKSCNQEGPQVLCATTNVQGRFANGIKVPKVCTQNAPHASQRFYHLELGKPLRMSDSSLGYRAVIDILKDLIPSEF